MQPESHLEQPIYWQNPLALPEEKIFLAERKYWLVLVPPLSLLIIFSLFFIVVCNYVFLFLINLSLLALVGSLIVLSFSLTLFLKIVTEWYFEIYVVTNRRLLEIRYTPLASYVLNDVLLDQVRCTEVDISTTGIINKYLDIGNIAMTFDRPTHQQEFIMSSIKDFHKLSTFLCSHLIGGKQQTSQATGFWYKSKKQRIFQFIGEPKQQTLYSRT